MQNFVTELFDRIAAALVIPFCYLGTIFKSSDDFFDQEKDELISLLFASRQVIAAVIFFSNFVIVMIN